VSLLLSEAIDLGGSVPFIASIDSAKTNGGLILG
jgi:hypothetical protein